MAVPTSGQPAADEPGSLAIGLDPDEWRGLTALAEVRAAHGGTEPDRARLGAELLREALEEHLAEAGLGWDPAPEAVQRRVAAASRPVSGLRQRLATARTRRILTAVLLVAVLVVLCGGYVLHWRWTGFQGNEQLWDWLRLLLLPLVVGTAPIWFMHPEYLSRPWQRAYLVAGLAFAALVVAGYLVPMNWTGFPGTTLWDWLGLILLPAAVAGARFLPGAIRGLAPRHWWLVCVAGLAWLVTVIGGYALHWRWTGYQGNTLWDWLGLLLLPLLVPIVLMPVAVRWMAVPSSRSAASLVYRSANTPSPSAKR